MENIVVRMNDRFGAKILKCEERSSRRIYMDISCEDIVAAAKFMFVDLNCRFAIATGTDTPDGIEMLYHFSYDPSGKMISLRALIKDKNNPQIASITPIITGAEWIEREIWELLGVKFVGHPNLKHLLLVDDWPEGKFPLRKKNVA